MNVDLKITAAEAVKRAKNAAKNCPTTYHLGAGGSHPEHACPGDNGHCDCSGFVAWTLGINRQQPETLGWIETTRVWHDAVASHALFQHITEALPGDVIVYPDTSDGQHQGHIGLVTSTAKGKVLRVCHCCARSGLVSAIIDEPASVFWDGAMAHRGAILARYRHFKTEDEMDEVKIIVDGQPSKFTGRFDPEQGLNYIPVAALNGLLLPGVIVNYRKQEKTIEIKTPKSVKP